MLKLPVPGPRQFDDALRTLAADPAWGKLRLPPPRPRAPAGAKREGDEVLAQRIGFGPTASERMQIAQAGAQAFVETQLQPADLSDPLDQLLPRVLPTLAMSSTQIIALVRDGGNPARAAIELLAATILRRLASPRQLYEQMVAFWNDHFSVHLQDGLVLYLKSADDREVARAHALGSFGELLLASARSPAMLFYLDNYASAADAINENYARELLELHTLGVDGGYTEHDVTEVARAFTGWTIDPREPSLGQFVFVPQRHDYGAKRVLGVDLPAGQGISDGEQVLAMLAAHPSTARHVCGKLARRFVADDPPSALIDRLAQVYLARAGDLREVLRELLLSAKLAGSGGAKLKRPDEFVLSALRAIGARIDGPALAPLLQQLSILGQLPFQWPAPNGYPDVEGYWAGTQAVLERWNFGFALAEQRAGPGISYDETRLAGPAFTPRQVVDRLVAVVSPVALAAQEYEAVLALAADGGSPDRRLDKRQREAAVQAVLGALYATPTCQRR